MPRLFNKISRRRFVAGAAATAAVAAAPAVALSGCSSGASASEELIQGVREEFPHAKVEYLDVDPSQIRPHTDMNNVESADYFALTNDFQLPLGSLIYQSSDTKAVVLAPGASSRALIRIELLDLNSGELTPLLGQALGYNEDYIIYDARASDNAIIWVECNMVHGLWRVYAAPITGGIINEDLMREAVLIDEGAENYSPPLLAVADKKIYWTVMPDPFGPASSEDSYLKAAELTSKKEPDTHVVYTSHGRMITTPVVSGSTLAFVPRVSTDLVYYQLTTLDTSSDEVQNIAILPPSLRVANAAWLGEGFAFGIEGNYDYAKGLSLFGTYEQLDDGDFIYINKAPVSAPVRIKDFTCIKSTKNVLGIRALGGNVAILDTLQNCVSYGDILAGGGEENRLVLYTTVTPRIGKGDGVCHVRVFDLV